MIAQRGMTLLEVMVASAILAITLAAMVFNIGQQTNNLSYLQDKTQAAWLAQDLLLLDKFEANDRLRESLTSGGSQGLPDLGKKSGKVEHLGRHWYWQMEVKENASDEMRTLILSLRLDEDADPLYSLRAFRSKKAASGPVTPDQLPDPSGSGNTNKESNNSNSNNTNNANGSTTPSISTGTRTGTSPTGSGGTP